MHLGSKDQPFTYILNPPYSRTQAVPLSIGDQNLEFYFCVLTPQTGGVSLTTKFQFWQFQQQEWRAQFPSRVALNLPV